MNENTTFTSPTLKIVFPLSGGNAVWFEVLHRITQEDFDRVIELLQLSKDTIVEKTATGSANRVDQKVRPTTGNGSTTAVDKVLEYLESRAESGATCAEIIAATGCNSATPYQLVSAARAQKRGKRFYHASVVLDEQQAASDPNAN